MKTIVIASTREGAGKTSIIIGLMKALENQAGYMKPFGDRLIYRRKRNWDYDSSLVIDLFKLSEEPENITLGFDHSKLRFVHDAESVRHALAEMRGTVGRDRSYVFVEGGKDIAYGASIHLDALTVAGCLAAPMILVVNGDNDTVLDDLRFFKRSVNTSGVTLAGIIVNKVRDLDEFDDVCRKEINEMGVPVLGVIPYKEQLTNFTVSYLAEKLYAKVLVGERGMSSVVKNIFVGAMSTEETFRNPLFNKEQKFLITSGDRSDMIVAALESDTKGILLTNNILPPHQIIAKANDRNIPILVVTMDTYQVTRQLDRMEALCTADNADRVKMLGQLVSRYCAVKEITG